MRLFKFKALHELTEAYTCSVNCEASVEDKFSKA